jgi:nitroreductase
MSAKSPETSPLLRLQTEHRSIRRYTGEPIAEGLLVDLIRAGQGAASSSFIQAYSVIRVTRAEARRAIAESAGNQPWIEQAAEFLVFCADLRRIDSACRAQGAGPLEGWAEHSLAAVVDTALMAQGVLLAAESVGLGGVFIGGIRNDPEVLVEQLKLPRLVVPLFGLCLGWPAESPQVKPRLPVELILHQDEYRDPEPALVQSYDEVMGAYYRARGNNARRSDWSATTARAVQRKKRAHLLPFLHRMGLFLR